MKPIKKSLALILALTLCLGMATVPVMAETEASPEATITFTLSNGDGALEVYPSELKVTDEDEDGALTVNDAMIAGHNKYFEGGAEAGYALSTSGYITKLWGVSNGGGYGYYVNDVASWSIKDPIKTGDRLYAFIYQDTEFWTDYYTYFDKSEVNVYAGSDVSVQVLAQSAFGNSAFGLENVILYSEELPEDYFVTDEDGYVTINLEKAGTYEFVGYSEEDYITPPVLKVNVCDFADVPSGHWAFEEVKEAVNRGISSGVSNTKFDVDAVMTRGMMVCNLYRMSGDTASVADMPFTDVEEDAYYAEAVAWAAEKGITAGISEEKFAPDAPVTREQAAAMLFRYNEVMEILLPGEGDLSIFSDADDISSWAAEAMAWANGAGILQGSGGKINPIASTPDGIGITRAEGAAIAVRFNILIERIERVQ